MAQVRLEHITKVFGDGAEAATAVDDVSLEIPDHEFMILLGPSGCGKSTLLRMVAGLEDPTEGDVFIDDVRVNDVEPKLRDVAMVFQSYALYPHKTVAKNIEFPLKVRGVGKAERAAEAQRAAEVLGLDPYLGRKPGQLSGGQRQRVALARAIVRRPAVFLMDEPLSNLDAKLRGDTRAELVDLHRRLDSTFLYVTHDQVEAMTMGDRVAVLKDGILQQCASPRDLFTRPANLFVAGFIGSPAMNMVECSVQGDTAEFASMQVPLTREQRSALTTDAVTIGVRPEGLHLSPDGIGMHATIAVVEELGSDSYLYCVPEGHQETSIVSRTEGLSTARVGDSVVLRPDPGAVHLFDTATGARLPD